VDLFTGCFCGVLGLCRVGLLFRPKGSKGINEPPPSRGEAFSNSSAQHNTRDRLVLGPISFFGLFVTRPSLSYFIFQQKIISLD